MLGGTLDKPHLDSIEDRAKMEALRVWSYQRVWRMPIQRKAVTKRAAATAQLETAIKLYFENLDLISAYTLCVAADGILEGIYRNKRAEILKHHRDKIENPEDFRFSWAEECEIRIKPQHRREAFQHLNKSQNFFKHADKDHDDILEFADVELTGARIFSAITNFHLVFQDITPAMSVFLDGL